MLDRCKLEATEAISLIVVPLTSDDISREILSAALQSPASYRYTLNDRAIW
jgi:hypothetical protein